LMYEIPLFFRLNTVSFAALFPVLRIVCFHRNRYFPVKNTTVLGAIVSVKSPPKYSRTFSPSVLPSSKWHATVPRKSEWIGRTLGTAFSSMV